MAAPHPESAQDRVVELDGLRGVAILMVLVFHYFANPVVPSAGSWLNYLQLGGYLGWTGVDLFFVLSGYLIGGILLDNRDSPRYFGTFYLRRACRILPIYLLVMAVFGLLLIAQSEWGAPLYRNATNFVHYLLFIQNYFVDEMGGYGPIMTSVTWSLAIEEQFYLVIPVLVRYLSPRLLLVSLLLLVGLAPVARELTSGLQSITYTFCRGDSLLTGVLIAWLCRNRKEMLIQYRWLIIIAFLLFSAAMLRLNLVWAPNGGAVEHLVFAGFYGSIIVLVVGPGLRVLMRVLRLRWLRWLGLRSYGIYLYHLPVAYVLFSSFGMKHRIVTGIDLVMPAVALVVCLMIAALSFQYIERPLIRYGHRATY